MPADYLHRHPEFSALLQIVAGQKGIDPILVEKDYWMMHCLHGLQKQGFSFELKGGTSLSKGFGIIHRFSEDIDIRINPPSQLEVKSGRNHNKEAHIKSREKFYAWLAENIKIEGIDSVLRDQNFDDSKLRSAGIRLLYEEKFGALEGLKSGVLLEAGFDEVTPNLPVTISSWAYDFGAQRVKAIDNRAIGVPCYHPGYTLVEKLQTISTKFRKQQESGEFPANFLRHYYDVSCLLAEPRVMEFIGTEKYKAHKELHFRSEEKDITINPAFTFENQATLALYEEAFRRTGSLYYQGRPTFSMIIDKINSYSSVM